MTKVIAIKRFDQGVSIVHPTNNWQDQCPPNTPIEDYLSIEAEKVIKQSPLYESYRIIDIAAIPVSRNYRNAWTDDMPTKTVDISLEEAKKEHKALIIRIGMERATRNEFGELDLTELKAQLAVLDIEGATTLTELYNLWPACINTRTGNREYVVHA